MAGTCHTAGGHKTKVHGVHSVWLGMGRVGVLRNQYRKNEMLAK
jgi:hypothetical protein